MSLGLWEFFWTESDWLDNPAPVVLPQADEPRGSGGGHGPFIKESKEYRPAGEDFWEVREAYLRNNLPKREEVFVEPETEPEEVKKLINERKQAFEDAIIAQSESRMVEMTRRVIDLTVQIKMLRAQYDDDAILILLLSL